MTDEHLIADALRQENERLKAEIKSLEYTISTYSNRDIDNAVTLFAKDKAELESRLSLANAYVNTYRSCLQEIKEIANKAYHVKLEKRDCIECDEYWYEILDKIAEVMK